MARNTSVSLGDHFVGFIERKVAEGRYASASDVVRAGLRLLEQDEVAFEQLKTELTAANRQAEAGDTVEFDVDDFLASTRKARA